MELDEGKGTTDADTNPEFDRGREAGRLEGYAHGYAAAVDDFRRLVAGMNGVPAQNGWLPPRFQEVDATLRLTEPIEELDFSVRLYDLLRRSGMNTIADLMAHTLEALPGVIRRRSGYTLHETQLTDIKDHLARFGYHLLETGQPLQDEDVES